MVSKSGPPADPIYRLPLRNIHCHICGARHLTEDDLATCGPERARTCPHLAKRGPTPAFAADYPDVGPRP